MRRATALGALIALAIGLVVLPASSSSSPAPSLPQSVQLAGSPDATTVSAAARFEAAAAVGWLDRLNSYRATAGLAPLAEVPAWSEAARLHSNYLVINDRAGHTEDPSLPGYTPQGAAAGANGNVISSTGQLGEADAIDAWMTAPFHALGMLDPRLTATGFGLVSNQADPGVRAAATLDVIRGLNWSVTWPSAPVVWPGPSQVVPVGSYDGNEWPDPLGGCGPGWTAPTGLPVIFQMPNVVLSAVASVDGVSNTGAVCVVTAENFVASTASSQQLGRDVLKARNAVLVIPRTPIANGQTVSVNLLATLVDGSLYESRTSFSVSSAPFGGRPVWAELTPGATGYWVVTDTGRVDAAGTAADLGGVDHIPLVEPVVSMKTTPSGAGYWLLARDGGVFTFGDAAFHGSAGAEPLRGNTVAIEATPTGRGYWIATNAGEVRAYGDAGWRGDMSPFTLARPVVDIARTHTGNGYWMVADDGGVFAFGDAAFHGSAGGLPLVQPVVALEPTPSGNGYWLLALDGGIFTYGDAQFHGSAGGITLDSPVRAMRSSPSGRGYWLMTERGQVLAFGDAVTGLG